MGVIGSWTMRCAVFVALFLSISATASMYPHPFDFISENNRLRSEMGGEIEKLVEEAIDSLLHHVIPPTVNLTDGESVNKTMNIPLLGTVSVEMAFTGTQLQA